MKRNIIVFAIAMALSAGSLVFAQDKCTVSGEVLYSGDSNIYVCLLNSTTFAAAVGREKELPPPGFVQIVKVKGSSKASFIFENVPKGEYVVSAFADKNNNGKMDIDTSYTLIEPTDYYKPRVHGRDCNWYGQKFKVDKDVTGIVLKLY